MLQKLNTPLWQYTKKKAELFKEGSSLVKMEFRRKATHEKIGKRKLRLLQLLQMDLVFENKIPNA